MASSNDAFPKTPPSTSTVSDAKSFSSPGKRRSPSPDQCCSICLGPFRDKSFTDSCFHTFCFSCLQEWAKVKPVCPLCKASFNSIIHNIRSNEDYDRMYLQVPSAANDEETRRFRYATTLTHERRFLLESRRMRQFARDARREERRRREEAAISRRQLIYSAGLRVLHMGSNQYSQFRDISPAFFRSNPAVTHRLVPWLRRELSVLFNNQEENVTFMTHYILSLINNVDIQSEEFHTNLRPFLHDTVEHFVHEFVSFARSPYDMNTYDQMSQYDFSGDISGRLPPRRPNQSLLASLQPQENDSDDNSVILLASDHESEPMVISDDNASEHEVEIIQNNEAPVVEEEQEQEEEEEENSESESSDSSDEESEEESGSESDDQVIDVSDDSSTHNPEPPLPFDPDRPGPSGVQSAATAVPVKEEPPDFHDSEHSDIEFIAIYDGSKERTPEMLSSESETERIALEEAERRWLEERARRKKEKEKRKQANAAAQSNNNSNSTNSRTAASRKSLSRSPSRSHRRRHRSTSSSAERVHRSFRRSRSRDLHTRRRRSRSRSRGFFNHRSRSRSETPQPKSWRERFGYISLSPSPTRVLPSNNQKKNKSRSSDRRDKTSSASGSSHRRRSKSREKSPPRKTKSGSKNRKSRSRSRERHSHVKSHSKHKKSKKHSKKRSRSRSRSRRR